MRAEMIVDAKAHHKAKFYMRQILVVQENFKLFTVLLGVFSLVMLPLDIANACTGGVALWLSVLLNVLWGCAVCGYVAYVLVASARKRAYFEKIGALAYGELTAPYRVFTVEEAPAPLRAGERIRLYDNGAHYTIVCDGLDAYNMQFWTRYDFRRDFGAIHLEKTDFTFREGEKAEIVGENFCIKLQGEEQV